MNKLVFENKVYMKILVEKTPSEFENSLTVLQLKAKECLENSVKVARRFPDVTIVEGWLITEFADSELETEGHVWNRFNKTYFDVSVPLVKHNRKVINQSYYLAECYTLEQIAIEEEWDLSKGELQSFSLPKIKKGVFKTHVKKLEKSLQTFLRQEARV